MKTIGLVVALLWAGVATASLDTKEAFYLYLNRSGLQLTAQELQNQFLQDIQHASLPNFEEKGFAGIKAKGTGIRYSVDFGNLSLVPTGGRLDVRLGINRIRLDVSSIRFSKKILFEISSTCKDTGVEVGLTNLDAHLGLSVSNGQVRVANQHTAFPITENNFKVHGPRTCSGVLGVGHIIKLVVKEVIKRSRDTIRNKVLEKVRAMTPTLQAKLNQAVHREVPFEVKQFLSPRDMSPVLRTSPHNLKLTSRGLEFALSVEVARDLDAPEQLEVDDYFVDLMSVGQAGVNPQLFGEILEKVIPVGAWIALEEELVPGVKEALSVENASAIWPDLSEIELTKSHLRPMLSFGGPPVFEVLADEALVKVRIPLRLLFQIHQDSWRNYFHIKLDLELTTALGIENERLSLSLKPETVLSLEGNWDSDYQPKVNLFEGEVAELVFLSLFDILYAQGPLLNVAVPKVEFGNKEVTIQNPFVGAPYIKVDLMAN